MAIKRRPSFLHKRAEWTRDSPLCSHLDTAWLISLATLRIIFEEVRDRSANPSFENRDPKRPVLVVLTFVRVQDKAELCVQRAVQRGMVVGSLSLEFR